MVKRGIIIAKLKQGAEAKDAEIFAETDSSELPLMTAVRTRSLFVIDDVNVTLAQLEAHVGAQAACMRNGATGNRHSNSRFSGSRLVTSIARFEQALRSLLTSGAVVCSASKLSSMRRVGCSIRRSWRTSRTSVPGVTRTLSASAIAG